MGKIRWRLRVVMADRKITNQALSQVVGMHPVSISKLKNADDMPAIGGETLAKLCDALNCTPADLIQYVPDAEE
ncbi:helix-turn-helix transcriptional regulator [Leptolyngbya sp. FACHB-17]|uniref:helix-turn-helix domain-containing protein n=1 Tax=unclassified Leptolyngbya TaxID=2650499 RepID=UPI00321FD99A